MKFIFISLLFLTACCSPKPKEVRDINSPQSILLFDSSLREGSFALYINGKLKETILVTNVGPGSHHPEYILNSKFSDGEVVEVRMLEGTIVIASDNAVFDIDYQSKNYPGYHGFFVELVGSKLKLHPIGSVLLD